MAQGLSPYLMVNPPEENNLAPTLAQLMAQMQAAGTQANMPQEPQMPATPMPPAQAVAQVQAQLAPNLPKPLPTRPAIPQQQIEMAKNSDWELNTKKALAEQDAGVAGLERMMQEMQGAPRGINFSPLAAYMDSIVPGSKLSPAAASMAPMNEDQRQEKMLKLQDLIQQRRQNLATNALAPYKAQLDAYKDLMRTQAMGGRQERFDAGQDLKMFDKARKEQAGFTKDVGDFVNSYRNVENAITPDADGTVSVGRIQQSLSQFARLMGEKGVLTDTDTGRQLAPTLEIQLGKLQSILASEPNKRVPATQVAAMTDALAAAKMAYKESYNMKAGSFKNTYFDNPGSPYAGKEWAPMLVNELYKPLDLIDAPPVKTQGDPARARLEELRRKRDAAK